METPFLPHGLTINGGVPWLRRANLRRRSQFGRPNDGLIVGSILECNACVERFRCLTDLTIAVSDAIHAVFPHSAKNVALPVRVNGTEHSPGGWVYE